MRTQGLAAEAPVTGAEKAVIAIGASMWLLLVASVLLVALLLAFSVGSSS